MIGAGASYLYLQLLIWDVDSRDIEDDNLVMDADEVLDFPLPGIR